MSISISPPTAYSSFYPLDTETFSATVSNSTNTGVVWSLSGPGTLSGGVYTAPQSITGQTIATVTARAAADASVWASVTINLYPPSPPTVGISNLASSLPRGTYNYSFTTTADPLQTATFSMYDASTSATNCVLYYDAASHVLYLQGPTYDYLGNPNGVAWVSSGVVPSSGTLGDAGWGCTVDLGNSSVTSGSPSQWTINLMLNLPRGNNRFYMEATDYSGNDTFTVYLGSQNLY
jgi:hypothetical protein